MDHARTRLLAFLSATDAACGSRVAAQFKESIVGMSATPATLPAAEEAARATGTVVMLNGDSQPHESYAALLSKQLPPGDIGTHVFRRLTPQLDTSGKFHPAVPEAQRRGVLFDAATGTDGLWFRIAQPALAHKFLPDTISSGMDWNGILLPSEPRRGHVDFSEPGYDRSSRASHQTPPARSSA